MSSESVNHCTVAPHDIIAFWKSAGPDRWYHDDPVFDAEIRARFEPGWRTACNGGCDEWAATPEGALALLILLDQFSRNMFRGKADAFAADAQARDVARRAIARNFDLRIGEEMREFFYTPMMHSEALADQDWSVVLFDERVGRESKNYPYALGHRDLIRRFGRFPARNIALGRLSTSEERAFLAAPRTR
jgi:uncharacterized protein (DUF924 family)